MNDAGPLVLYVDDTWSNRVVFEESFAPKFAVTTVSGAAEALAFMAEAPVAVLVTDQRMPGKSGIELLREVKELYPETVRVIVTAYSDLNPILRAVNEGLVARYVVKPWDVDELEKLLAWAIEAHRAGRDDRALQARLIETERLATLGTIAGAVLHDVKQPLSYIKYAGDRLAQLAVSAPSLEQQMRAQSGDAFSAVDRANLLELAIELGALVDDLQTGCRVICEILGSMERLLRPEDATGAPPVADPGPVLRFSISLARRIVVGTGMRFVYEGPEKLRPVKMETTELMQVLLNTLTNAGQALLRRAKPGGRVVVEATEAAAGLIVTIADDGPGMGPDVLAKIGTPFFSQRPGGTGLGVSQCKRLLGHVGGGFEVSSQQGVGTTVTITIPLA